MFPEQIQIRIANYGIVVYVYAYDPSLITENLVHLVSRNWLDAVLSGGGIQRGL
jgi:hypothetical protein